MKGVEERLLVVALEEVAGKAAPPDLTGRVLGALATSGDASVGRIVHMPRRSRAVSLPCLVSWGALPASLLLLLWWVGPGAGEPVRAIEVMRVLRGEVEWEGAVSVRVNSGDAVELSVAPGDRMVTNAVGASLRIGTLAAFHPEPFTILEVIDMQMENRKGVVVLGGLTLAVVAGAVTWDSLVPGEPVRAGDAVVLEAAPDAGLVAELEDRAAQLARRVEELESQRDRDALPVPEEAEETTDVSEAPAPRFITDQYREALEAVDWKRFGAAMDEMSRINGEIAAQTLDEGEPSRELIARHRQLNGLLLELAQPLLEAGLPGEGGNGAFSHPLVVGNTIDFALQAAGLSLEGGQLEWLQGIAAQYAAQDENLRIGEGQDLASARFLSEMEMKRAMYGEMRQALSPDQRDLLFPDAARDRNQLELLGVGGDWGGFARTVPAHGPEDFARVVTVSFQSSLGLSEQQAARVGDLLRRYARSYPDSYWNEKSSELDRRGFMGVDRIHFAAKRQVELLREILRSVDLTPEQREQLMRTRNVLVPLPR